MDTVWDKIKKGLKDGAALSIEKIEEYTRIGKLKIEEMAANRKIDRHFLDIGERVVSLIEDGKASEIEKDLIVEKAMESINALRKELDEIDEKISEVTLEAQQAQKEDSDDDESDPDTSNAEKD